MADFFWFGRIDFRRRVAFVRLLSCFRLGRRVRLGINMVSVKSCGFEAFIPLPAGPRRNLAAPFFGGLHRLAVNDGSTGTGCPTLGLSQVGKEGVVGPLPGPILTPGAEVMEDNAPRWQVVGQHPPRATGAQHVANGVYDLAPRVLDRPTAGFGRRQQRQQLPLLVVQITGVNRSLHATTLRPTPNVTPLSAHPD